MGLWVLKNVVHAMDGVIDVHSLQGTGTSVVIFLPIQVNPNVIYKSYYHFLPKDQLN